MLYVNLFLFLVLLYIFILYFFKSEDDNRIYTKSMIDNKEYLVRNLNDKESASAIIGIISNRIKKLCFFLEEKKTKFNEYTKYIKNICKKAKTIKICESISDNKTTSYTVNKGDKIVLCLRSKQTGKIHDINLLMYVVIHELSHIACPEIGHTELFKQIFKMLLEFCIYIKIYERVDYEIKPEEYCGIIISENILH